MKKEFLTISVLLACTISVRSQQTDQLDSIIAKIQTMYQSDTANIFFSLEEVPSDLINKLQEVRDSALYLDLVYEGKSHKKQKANDEMFKRLKERKKIQPFIANNGDKWRPDDVVFAGDEKLPTRKFIFGVFKVRDLIFLYWHGGYGKHIHLVLIENENYSKLTGFVTNNNWDIIRKLDFDNKLTEIKSNKLNPLVKRSDIIVQQGKLISTADTF